MTRSAAWAAEPRRERVRGGAAPAGERRLGAGDAQVSLALRLHGERELLLGAPRVDPCEGHVASQVHLGDGEHGLLALRLGFGALAAQPALLGEGEVLHHADLSHRHGVGREAELVGPVRGQVLDRGDEARVGELGGGTLGGAGGAHRGRLRRELGRGGGGDRQRLVERELLGRRGLGRERERGGDADAMNHDSSGCERRGTARRAGRLPQRRNQMRRNPRRVSGGGE